jgi:hypothetical protein
MAWRVPHLLALLPVAAVACGDPDFGEKAERGNGASSPDGNGNSNSTSNPSNGNGSGTTPQSSTGLNNPLWSEKKIDGALVIEGDMVFPGATDAASALKNGTVERWRKAVIPYEVSADLPNPKRVDQAVAQWLTGTGIRFAPRTNEADYVIFMNGQGCSSAVGKKGGPQQISAAWDTKTNTGCQVEDIIHEMGHAIGLAHPHTRVDRDNYVSVLLENVQVGQEHNFDKTNFQSFGNYDVNSIMHFGSDFFSKTGNPTMRKKDGSALPRPKTLSDQDVQASRLYYATELPFVDTSSSGQGVEVSWPMKSNTATYSLDVQTTSGAWVQPCIDAGSIVRSLHVTFAGQCPAAPAPNVPISTVKAFRICWTEFNDWTQATCAEAAYTGQATVKIGQ